MRLSKFFTAVLFLLFIIAYLSCKKTDSVPNKETSKPERFFDVQASAPKEIKAIAEAIKKQNERHQFLSSIIKSAGYPRWDKARIVNFETGMVSGRGSEEANGEIVYIPFVKDTDNYVNSLLAVKLSKEDTVYRMLHDYKYRSFGFDTTDHSKWNARDVFNIFASFDNSVFGHTKFIIKDGRIFGKDTASAFVITLVDSHRSGKSSLKTSLMEPVEICVSYTMCGSCDAYVRADRTDILRTQDCCYPITLTQCTTYWVEIVDGGGGGSGNDNGGWTGNGDGIGDPGSGGGGGGTGNDGGGWYDGGSDPCIGSPAPVQRASGMDPINDCGNGWEVPVDDRDYFDYPHPGDDPEFVSANPYETDCKSFQFTKTGNYWQEAGVRKIKFKVYYLDPYGSKTWLDCEVNQVVIGLPPRFSSGGAANLAARAVDYARKETYAYTASYGGTLTAAEAVQYFRTKLNSIVAEKGGTASVNGSSSPLIVFKDAESTFWTNPYDC